MYIWNTEGCGKKRARVSPAKRNAKKLFADEETEKNGGGDCVSAAAEPREGKDDA